MTTAPSSIIRPRFFKMEICSGMSIGIFVYFIHVLHA